MIWENNVHVIVMASNIIVCINANRLAIISYISQENDHVKCHQYYPADDRSPDGPNFIQFDQVKFA